LHGVVHFGETIHLQNLEAALSNDKFSYQEDKIIEKMYNFYIEPYRMTGRCQTPASSCSSSQNSGDNLNDSTPELKHSDLKRAVLKRDSACLFCWGTALCEVAHIIAQVNAFLIPYDELYLFQQAGFEQKNQVQNGL
jgi:hypothetical protein